MQFQSLERPPVFAFLEQTRHILIQFPPRLPTLLAQGCGTCPRLAPAAGVNKSEHTKTFSRGYQCGDGVADAACHWLHLQSIMQPGRAGLPCSPPSPEEQMCLVWRHRLSSPWKETRRSASCCSSYVAGSRCLWWQMAGECWSISCAGEVECVC